MRKAGLAAVVRHQMRVLLGHLRRARRGNPRAIHQARVASRRLREALPVAATAGSAARRNDPGHDVRRITRALGAVREMDVASQEFDRDAGAHPWNPAAVVRMREYLTHERDTRAREMRAKLDRVDVKRLNERIRELASACDAGSTASWQHGVSLRGRKRARRFAEALRASGTLYAVESLHSVRIAGKKLRYTLELARAAMGAPFGREIATLKRLQDLLGRLRDLQVLQGHVRTVALDAADRALGAGLDEIQRELDAECRMLHARFLARIDRLLAIAERLSRTIPGASAPRPMTRMVEVSGSARSSRRAESA